MQAGSGYQIEISDEEEAAIQAGIASDPDNPELTAEELASLRPASEVLPRELYAALTRGPAGQGEIDAAVVRLDPDVLAHFRATGPGWEARVNAALRVSMRAA